MGEKKDRGGKITTPKAARKTGRMAGTCGGLMSQADFPATPDQHGEPEFLLEEGRAQVLAGDFPQAAQCFRRALSVAQRVQDQPLADLALVNAFSVEVDLRPTARSIATARSLFARTTDPIVRFICCSALARHYQGTSNYRMALFYGRIAHAIAPPARRGEANHLLGIILLGCGKAEEAMALLRHGLQTSTRLSSPPSMSLGALAYGAALLNDHRASRRYMRETETLFDQSRASVYDGSVHLSLGYTALERCEPDQAGMHARKALSCLPLAPSHDHKAALYLAGEAALQTGSRADGEHFLDELQRLYFPQFPGVTDLLIALRTAAFINWLA